MQYTHETATVSFIKGDYAFLETVSAESSCSKCSSRSSCGSLSFFNRPASHLRVKNTIDLKAGDSVVLALGTNKILFGTVVMYLLPLLVLFLFAAIGKSFGSELFSIVAGLCGLFGSLLLIKKFVKKASVAKGFEPTIIRKVTL